MEDQKAILERIRSGDEAAMTQLIRSELPRVYNLCFRLTRRQQEAEDLCQDTFVKAVRSIKNFKGEAAISTWLYRIAVNTWKNQIRHQSRRKATMHVSIHGNGNKDEGSKPIDIADDRPTPEEIAEKKEGIHTLMSALNRLKPEEKSIIVFRDIEHRSYEEIADLMDLNIGTVKSRLSRAREQFRDIYNLLGVQNP